MKSMSMVGSVLVALSIPLSAEAKGLYVDTANPACSDATTYAANTATSPWCTIGRAAWGTTDPTSSNSAEAAQAGDTVSIAAGTYVTTGPQTTCSRWNVALNPANSGTSGAPITFRGVGATNIYLAAGYMGPTIGAHSRNYVIWDNVRIDEQAAQGTSCADTGPVVVHDSTGSKILNSTVRGSYKAWGDNYNGIRVEAVNGAVVANNTIYDITCNFGSNCAGIMTYDTANSIFENNNIHDTTTAIFIKGEHTGDGWPQINNVVRGNWLENNAGSAVYGIGAPGTKIYQNILKDNASAVRFNVLGPGTDNVYVVNNTIVSTNLRPADVGYRVNVLIADMMNVRVHNNIFYGSLSEAINLGDAPTLGTHSFEHNVYAGFDVFGSLNGAQINFSTWKGTYNQDNAAPAGINGDPLFVDTTHYRLQAGSPARTVGVDILDLNADGSTTDIIPAGAYVTGAETIGPGGAGLGSPDGGVTPGGDGGTPGEVGGAGGSDGAGAAPGPIANSDDDGCSVVRSRPIGATCATASWALMLAAAAIWRIRRHRQTGHAPRKRMRR